MIIYLVRHAEYVPVQGGSHLDNEKAPLSSLGKKQAFALGRKLKRYKIDKIYSSVLARAKETASFIVSSTGVPVVYDERLNEQIISLHSTDRSAIKKMKRRVREDHAFAPPDGESLNQAADRFIRVLHEVVRSGLSQVVFVSHCNVIQSALITLFSLNEIPKIDEASVTAFSYESGKFSTLFVNKKTFSLPVIFRKIRRKLGLRE